MSLPWAPCECFDCCFVVREAVFRLRHNIRPMMHESSALENTASHSCVDVPDAQKIVVTTTGKLLPVWTPFQTANFLSMSRESAYDRLVLRASDIRVMN